MARARTFWAAVACVRLVSTTCVSRGGGTPADRAADTVAARVRCSCVRALDLTAGTQTLQDTWLKLKGSRLRGVRGDVHVQFRFVPIALQAGAVSVADFEVLHLVGKGSFGRVLQVRKKSTGRIYAMKVVRKAMLLERYARPPPMPKQPAPLVVPTAPTKMLMSPHPPRPVVFPCFPRRRRMCRNEVDHALAERQVLSLQSSPFIVHLKYAFHTATKVNVASRS